MELCAIGFFAIAPFTWRFDQRMVGINMDPADLLLLPALAVLIIRKFSSVLALPFRGAFLLYLILTAAAYANSVYALGYLSDPLSAGYQFCRYAWKPSLAFPLTYFLIHGRRSRALILTLILTIIAVADLNALAGIWQGRHGFRPTGLFGAIGHGNNLASSVFLPAFMALGVAVSLPNITWKGFAYGSFAAILVTLWYAGSRGGAVAFLTGLAAYLALGQARLKVIGSAVMLLIVLFAVNPDFGRRSGIRARFAEVAEGTQAGTLEWRLTERWPYFLDKVLDNPWLGVGTDEDLSLGEGANTPHNGYLSLAVKSGLPSLGLFLCFLAFTLVRSAIVASRGLSAFERGIGAGVFAGTVAIATHNLADSTFGFGSTGYLLWMACGLVATLPLAPIGEAPARVPFRSTDLRLRDTPSVTPLGPKGYGCK